jgi:hypothetical protein
VAILPRLVFFAVVLATQVGLGVYVTARAIAPRRTEGRTARRWLLVACVAAVALSTIIELSARLYAPVGGGIWRPLVWLSRLSGFTLFASAAGILGVHLVSNAWRLVERIRPRPEAPPPDAPTRREVIAQGLSLAVTGTAGAATLYGALRERHDLQLTEASVNVPDLPPSLDGLTIVQITDLHIGIFTGPRELDRLIERVNALRGDLVVITGDILDNNPAHVPDAVRALARLRGRLGVHAILGNHDHYTGREAVRGGFAAAGISCLVNAAVKVHTGDPRRGSITLAGVDDVMAPRLFGGVGPDLRRALAGADPEAPVVLLAHNPVYFTKAAGRVALQLSGHTHGGQVNVGHVADRLMPFVAGRYERGGSSLFVSRGVGITGPPVRLAAPPEVVRVSLTARRT